MPSWKLTAYASKDVVERALVASEAMADWDVDIVLAGFEVSEDKPDDWQQTLERRGIRTQGSVLREEAAAVLTAYAHRDGHIYHPEKT